MAAPFVLASFDGIVLLGDLELRRLLLCRGSFVQTAEKMKEFHTKERVCCAFLHLLRLL